MRMTTAATAAEAHALARADPEQPRRGSSCRRPRPRRTRTAITASTLRSGQASLPARPANRPFVKTATRGTCERRPTSRGKPMRLELLGSVPSARRNAAVRSAGVTRTTCTASDTGASSRPSRAHSRSGPPRAHSVSPLAGKIRCEEDGSVDGRIEARRRGRNQIVVIKSIRYQSRAYGPLGKCWYTVP